MSKRIQGVWTALITPMKKSGKIDMTAWQALLKDQIDAGVDGVIPCGTTGESPTLSLDEKKSLIESALKATRGSKTKVIAGTGSNNTADTQEFSKWASDAGVQGVLIVCPYYNKPTQEGLETHFKLVADAANCPVVVYNVPGRTSIGLSSETLSRLMSHPNIKTIKEASGDINLTQEVLSHCKKSSDIDILSGDDALWMPLASVGATGVISVASNLIPRAMVKMQSCFARGDFRSASEIQSKYYPIFRDLFLESNPIPVKYAMSWAGLCEDHLRLPLTPISSATKSQLEKTLSSCGLVKNKGTR